MIASHYAEPLERVLITDAALIASPETSEAPLASLEAGEEMRVLDISRGWAWGYGPGGQVGYVPAAAITG